MINELMHDPIFLEGKSEMATKYDLPVAQDLLDTLAAHKDSCVGMAANMIGVKKCIIAFLDESGRVPTYQDNDETEKTEDEVIPFQVAYAVSIHKAQGLEYQSVKVVVTNELEELITHNVFYTAITRACSVLKVY